MVGISTDFEGSVCEIKTADNVLLTIGIITKITRDYVEIESYRGEDLALLRVDTTVKISTHKNNKFEIAMGVVYISSEQKMKLVDVQSLQDFERRGFFRVPIIDCVTSMMPVGEDGVKPSYDQPPIPVSINNISLSGLLFTPVEEGRKFLPNSKYVIDIPLDRRHIEVNIEVCRISQVGNMPTTYGCSYYEMNERKSDMLYTYIFNLEREYLKNRKK